MMNFFSEYPIVKWILVGLGVLYLLERYLGLDLWDKLFNKKQKYRFTETNHLHDEKLKSLIALFNTKHFKEVENQFKGFNSSYRSFGFRSLGQYGNIEITEEWLKSESESTVAQMIKGYQLIFKAWEVRGRDTIDTVSEKDIQKFKEILFEAKSILKKVSTSLFEMNRVASLLKIQKALRDENRAYLHHLYDTANELDPNNVELNFNYFSAISIKWGGTDEELQQYFKIINTKSEFIQILISTQYYYDNIHLYDYEDSKGTIENFLVQMRDKTIDTSELYRFELYVLLYWIANNLGFETLESHFKQLALPYWQD